MLSQFMFISKFISREFFFFFLMLYLYTALKKGNNISKKIYMKQNK